jgi:Holliday junction resolvasome RuvABC endonuclease subunit
VKILSFDTSTKSGWCFSECDSDSFKIIASGAIPKRSEPQLVYPQSYYVWAKDCYQDLMAIIKNYPDFDVLVLEETVKSRNSFSQKILEFIHFQLVEFIVNNQIKSKYYRPSEWRKIVGASLTKTEKEKNKQVRKEHKKGNKVVKDESGKRIGLVGKKNVSIRFINEYFGLNFKRKNEDEAEAICLSLAHWIENIRKI